MFYTRIPGEEELTGTGFTPADYVEEIEVWPDAWPTFELFAQLDTQWSSGVNGRTGLSYPVLFGLMDRRGLAGDDWQETFDDIRAMERTALAEMAKR